MKILVILLTLSSTFAAVDFSAFKEQQKDHFIANEWEQFFGQASFYRRKLLPTNPQLFDRGLLTLEILGLAKHCQWQATDSLLDAFDTDYKEQDWAELRGKVELLKKFAQVGKVTKLPRKTPSMRSGQSLFRATSDEVMQVEVPSNLRVQVENQCAL